MKILKDAILLILVHQRALKSYPFFDFSFPLNISSCLRAFCLLLYHSHSALLLFVTHAFENEQLGPLTFPLYCSPTPLSLWNISDVIISP